MRPWMRKHPLPRLLALLLLAGLLAPPATTVWAESPVAEEARNPHASDLDEPGLVVGPPGQTLVANEQSTPVGPGLTLTTFDRFDARGWVRGYVLKADLAHPQLSVDLLYPGAISAAEPLSQSARRQGAIAGVNGDFFDINNSKAPLGAAVKDGELLKSGVPGWKAAGVGTDGVGRLAELFLEGAVTLPGGVKPLAALNQSSVPANGIGLYTPVWGSFSRVSAAGGSANVREVLVRDGRVLSVATTPGSGPIAAGSFVLLGREGGADALGALAVGDPVSIHYAPRADVAAPFESAVGGNVLLVNDGQVPALDDRDAHPRTAVGFSADGKTMWLVTVDGRQKESRGMTLLELGQLMQALGAHQALNLDGGGSSTLLARLPGDPSATVANSPSDGFERAVPNGLGLFAAPGSGQLRGISVSPVAGSDRVFPGLSRTYAAKGYDETYAPAAAGAVSWQALPADVGTWEANGVFTGRKTGTAAVRAQVQSVMGWGTVRVLGALDRIEANPGQLGLSAGGSATFTVTGYDADGYAAPIEPRDISLAYDTDVIRVAPAGDGGYRVTAVGEGASLVTIQVLGKTAYLPVTVGLATVGVNGFENPAEWLVTKYPAVVGADMSFAPGRTGQALKLSYDFSTTTATRAAYVQANPLLELPGQPQRIGLWVNGDGQGAWLRMVMRDAMNTNYTLNLANKVDWTGWRYVETMVPPGVQYPLRLYRIYPVETNKARQYTGALLFDDIVVKVPAEMTVPEAPVMADPLVVRNGALEESRWKFAVLSDLHIVGSAPNSKDVALSRQAIRQALAANPDFLIIAGDFVDTAYPQDFALAEQILNEEVGGRVPVYYIPGNHEIMGTGTLENFLARFGPNRMTFDHKGTRFILLDSATGTLRSDFQQLVELQESLRQAAADPGVKNVVVVAHHPTKDPMPTASSQLSDPKEARLIEQWLTEFRESSAGKGAIYIAGHAHAVNVRRSEGVPYMVLGSVGKVPYGPVNKGGFYSWALFGVDPTPAPSGQNWIRAEVRALLESISLEAPATVSAGETVTVKAIGHQVTGLNVQLTYPATVTWSGSENLFIGSGDEAEQALRSGRYDAALDPLTGELKAARPGEILVRVTANGVSAEASVTIQQ